MELKDTVEMMLSADYRDRFRAEYYQAVIRCRKLDAMLHRYEAGTLDFKPSCSIDLLSHQKAMMLQYISDLEERAAIEHIKL